MFTILTSAPILPGLRASEETGLEKLPERIETRIPSVLEDRFADVEKVVSRLPGMDRKKAYLITLPLENYLEDVVLSADRSVLLYPRAIAWVIGREAARGTSKKRIARLLVSYYQLDAFKGVDVTNPTRLVSDASEGERP